MSGSASEGEADLTPVLDMVFQLITFFMLVINFKAASLDMTLKLPVIGSARPVDMKGTTELLILNINKEGKINVYGIPHDAQPYIKGEAMSSLLKAKLEKPTLKLGDELPTMVVLRADGVTTFNLLYNVIKLCQDNGYRRFAMRAMNREE